MRLAVIVLILASLCATSAPARETSIAWRPTASTQLPQLHRRRRHVMRAARAFFAPSAGSGRELYALVTAVADRHGIPASLAHAVVRAESGYRCSARSAGGARGIMQVLPGTARAVGVTGNLLDCATGLEAGMRYLQIALRAGGVGCAGASFYNTGVNRRPRCTAYGRRVMSLAGAAS